MSHNPTNLLTHQSLTCTHLSYSCNNHLYNIWSLLMSHSTNLWWSSGTVLWFCAFSPWPPAFSPSPPQIHSHSLVESLLTCPSPIAAHDYIIFQHNILTPCPSWPPRFSPAPPQFLIHSTSTHSLVDSLLTCPLARCASWSQHNFFYPLPTWLLYIIFYIDGKYSKRARVWSREGKSLRARDWEFETRRWEFHASHSEMESIWRQEDETTKMTIPWDGPLSHLQICL